MRISEEEFNRLTGVKKAKPRKYRNKPTVVDNITFHSKKEANHYLTLKRLLKSGHISELELQPQYLITHAGKRICKVILDFRYRDKRTGQVIHQDVKGKDNQLSKLKRKLLEAQFGFTVELI